MAIAGELIEDVEYEDVTGGGDEYFTGEGKRASDGDDWNSESDTAGDDADDIQARPVSKLGPKQAFVILS